MGEAGQLSIESAVGAGLDGGRTTQPGPMTEALAMAEKLKAEQKEPPAS